jgi:hypothetical protein
VGALWVVGIAFSGEVESGSPQKTRQTQGAEIAMPPLIVWALGAIGAAVAARWLVKEVRRINAELHPSEPIVERENAKQLVRDPKTGVYRPK